MGLSGVVVAVMNVLFGPGFVGGTTVWGTAGASIKETAQDAVVLRVAAGLLGLAVLAGYAALRHYGRPFAILPPGLVDALGAAAFAAAALGLSFASVDQAVTGPGGHGIGFFLSGALVSLTATMLFAIRATHAFLLRALPATNPQDHAEPIQ